MRRILPDNLRQTRLIKFVFNHCHETERFQFWFKLEYMGIAVVKQGLAIIPSHVVCFKWAVKESQYLYHSSVHLNAIWTF